ncbi:MAG: DUF433 domain-containing protein [Planctomycetota bacterium]
MNAPPTDKRDPRDVPNYTLAESARWLGLVPATMRVWLVGQDYRTSSGKKRMQPIVRPARAEGLGLSFWNLVECSVVASIRKTHGVSFQKVRRALDYVQRQLGTPRPLIQEQFATDGVNLFVERLGRLIAASQNGQTAMREILAASLTRIERDSKGLAARLFPWSHRPSEPMVVSVDPRVSFGRPVLANTGITVEVILGRFWAGDTIEHLALDYRVPEDSIEQLVRWGGGAAAA